MDLDLIIASLLVLSARFVDMLLLGCISCAHYKALIFGLRFRQTLYCN